MSFFYLLSKGFWCIIEHYSESNICRSIHVGGPSFKYAHCGLYLDLTQLSELEIQKYWGGNITFHDDECSLWGRLEEAARSLVGKLLCDILDHDRSKKGTILNFSRVSETNRHLHVHLSKEHAHVKKTVLLKAAVSYDKNSLSIWKSSMKAWLNQGQ